MKITERRSDQVTILDVSGRIAFGDGDEAFRDGVNKALQSGADQIVLNMSEVPFVDSSGIGEIVRLYVTLSKRGRRLKLLNLTRRVEEVLTMTKLLTVLEVFESEEAAIASFTPEH